MRAQSLSRRALKRRFLKSFLRRLQKSPWEKNSPFLHRLYWISFLLRQSFLKSQVSYHTISKPIIRLVIALDCRTRYPGFKAPAKLLVCIIYFGKMPHSHNALPTEEHKDIRDRKCERRLRKCLVLTCNGIAFHLGNLAIFLVRQCYEKRASWSMRIGLLGSRADLTVTCSKEQHLF